MLATAALGYISGPILLVKCSRVVPTHMLICSSVKVQILGERPVQRSRKRSADGQAPKRSGVGGSGEAARAGWLERGPPTMPTGPPSKRAAREAVAVIRLRLAVRHAVSDSLIGNQPVQAPWTCARIPPQQPICRAGTSVQDGSQPSAYRLIPWRFAGCDLVPDPPAARAFCVAGIGPVALRSGHCRCGCRYGGSVHRTLLAAEGHRQIGRR